jgi:hypothetical protein
VNGGNMKKKNIPIIILENREEIFGLDYINSKIVYVISSKKLDKNNVYLTNLDNIKSKRGEWFYTISLVKDTSIGKCDLNEFMIKCKHTIGKLDTTFDEIIKFKSFKYSSHLVRFSESELKEYKGKLQLKIGDRFVNISKSILNIKSNIGNFYTGYVLVKKILTKKTRFNIYNGLSIFGYFNNHKKNELYKNQNRRDLINMRKILDENMSIYNSETYDLKYNYRISFDLSFFKSYNNFLFSNYDYYDFQEETNNIENSNFIRDRNNEFESEGNNYDYTDFSKEIEYEPNIEDEKGYLASEIFNGNRVIETLEEQDDYYENRSNYSKQNFSEKEKNLMKI